MRPLALAPLAFLLSACATQPPAQYQPAPTASLAPNVAANLYAAQVAATQAQQATNAAQSATQAVATATWQALELRQAEAQSTIDYQRQLLDLQLTKQSISTTAQAISVSVQLTGIAIDRLESQATATAQADALKYSIMLREESERVKGGATYGGMYGGAMALGSLILVIGVAYVCARAINSIFKAIDAKIERMRNAPHLIPSNQTPYSPVLQQAQLPPAIAPPSQFSLDSASRETLDGLRLLRDALIYQEQNPEFSPRQIPRWERLRDAGLPQFGTGSAWTAARASFGALLTSDDSGTFVQDGDAQSLYDSLKSGRVALPYPIPARS